MMPASEKEFIKELVKRTKFNYSLVQTGPYEVTQLLNSAVGLLIIPQQKLFDRIADGMVSERLLKELLKSVTDNTYKKALDLSEIARHLRNSISHGKVEFKAEKQYVSDGPLQIESIEFTDENPKSKDRIVIEITVDILKQFFEEFSTAASVLDESDPHLIVSNIVL